MMRSPRRPAHLRGTVTDFDEHVGLGTIAADDGASYSFHCVELADGTRTIDVGAAVEFELLRKLGRLEARCVVKR